MKLVGVTSLVSKKSGSKLMKLSLLDDSIKTNRVGCDVDNVIVPYNEDYLSIVGSAINIFYGRSYDGRAIFDHIEVIKEGGK